MLELKACPRCAGDLYKNRDLYGNYVECLQCGYMKDLPEASALLKSRLNRRRKCCMAVSIRGA